MSPAARSWLRGLAPAIVATLAVLAGVLTAPGSRLVGRAYVDGYGTQWFYDLAGRVARGEGIDALMDTHRLDALVGGGAGVAAMAGYPSVIVPFGVGSPLPTGFLFYGRAWSEVKLLALAADFEARTRARREPTFLPSVETK
jgi:hypothetical protein